MTSTTDADGQFSLPPAPWEGTIRIVPAFDLSRNLASIVVGAESSHRVELSWDGNAVLRGVVVDDVGLPVPRASISVMEVGPGSESAGGTIAAWTSDELGRFEIEHAMPGAEYELRAVVAMVGVAVSGPIPAPDLDVRMALQRRAQIVGKASQSDGTPASGRIAWCTPQDRKGRPTLVTAAADGSFAIEVDAGRHVISTLGPLAFRLVDVTVQAGDTATLMLRGEALEVVRGSVVDRTGEPIASIVRESGGRKRRVRLRVVAASFGGSPGNELTTEVEPSGAFSLQFPRGSTSCELRVETTDGFDATTAVAVAVPGTVQLTWENPGARLFVDVEPADVQGREAEIWVKMGREFRKFLGRVDVEVSPGSATIVVGTPGSVAVAEDVRVTRGENRVRLVLRPGRVVRGTLLGPDGRALVGASVAAGFGELGLVNTAVETGSDGQFVLTGMPASRASVAIIVNGEVAATYLVDGNEVSIVHRLAMPR